MIRHDNLYFTQINSSKMTAYISRAFFSSDENEQAPIFGHDELLGGNLTYAEEGSGRSIKIAKNSNYGIEDIFIGTTGSEGYGAYTSIHFLPKKDFDAYIEQYKEFHKNIYNSEAGQKVLDETPCECSGDQTMRTNFSKDPNYPYTDSSYCDEIQTDLLDKHLLLAKAEKYTLEFFLSTPAQRLFNATGGGGGSVQFLDMDSPKELAAGILKEYPEYEAINTLEETYEPGCNKGFAFTYFRKSTDGKNVDDKLELIKPKNFNKKSADKITNFNPSTDTLEIDTDSFGIDSSATFASGKNKKVVKKKLAKQDFDFLYDEKKGGLYFNENGSDKGFGDGGIIAILKGAPELTSSNLEFI